MILSISSWSVKRIIIVESHTCVFKMRAQNEGFPFEERKMDYHSIRGNAEKDHNDCAVVAVAITANISYDESSRLLSAAGRIRHKGFADAKYHNVLRNLGFTVRDIRKNFKSKTVRTIERELARNYGGCKVLINIARHVLAWDGEKIVDWSAGRTGRIIGIHQVFPGVECPVGRSVPMPEQKAMRVTSRPTTEVWVRCPSLQLREWVHHKSLPAAYKANNWKPKGRQAARRLLKQFGSWKFPILSFDWSGEYWAEARTTQPTGDELLM